VPVAERFTHFRIIGAANNAFLESLGRLIEDVTAGDSAGLAAVSSAYESLTAPTATLVTALVAMTGGRYRSLQRRYEELERELAQAVLKTRPIEYGPLIIWPREHDSLHPEEVGPKSANLADVERTLGVHVPPFFVVSIYGYRAFMGATGLQDLVNETLSTVDLSDATAVETASTALHDAIIAASVPLVLADAVREAFARLLAEHPPVLRVAVRSSAVVEEAGLLEAYKAVVASKYRPGALHYATARGFVDEDVAMPVMVMTMVEPLAAGVAYSREPGRAERAVVTAVTGLARRLVEGGVVPARYNVLRASPATVVESFAGREEGEEGGSRRAAVLTDDQAMLVAETAWDLEAYFGAPQDVEWTFDRDGRLAVVQTRPLTLSGEREAPPTDRAPLPGYRVLVRNAVRAAGGIACGPAFRPLGPHELRAVPEDAVLVVPTIDPRLAGLMGRVGAIVAAAGSPTGHMATVAREFGTPCLVGVGEAAARFENGRTVTVDAWSGTVYEGEVRELLGDAPRLRAALRNPVQESLKALVDRAAPLTLTDPDSPRFQPRNCKTLHDVARFVHQRSMAEMFAIESLSLRERRQARRLVWPMPMDVLILDLGGGLQAGSERRVAPAEILSVPLEALLEGMSDPRLRWSGPVGFDLRGFMSVVVRSAADDQRYGEPSYALCSRDYAHFSSRLAYHFATVDSVCGALVNENYARFLFYGGAAISERRECRAHFLATVLEYNGFVVKRTGDRVEAVLGKRPPEAIEDALVMLGRLMVASRHLDMVMESQATAELFARAFLAGDYGFELVRKEQG
jgi:pyruvate,water dikinase